MGVGVGGCSSVGSSFDNDLVEVMGHIVDIVFFGLRFLGVEVVWAEVALRVGAIWAGGVWVLIVFSAWGLCE